MRMTPNILEPKDDDARARFHSDMHKMFTLMNRLDDRWGVQFQNICRAKLHQLESTSANTTN